MEDLGFSKESLWDSRLSSFGAPTMPQSGSSAPVGGKVENPTGSLTEKPSKVSPIFAYLPNGIIREIVSYTGATYKKRNGKYMGQIPKNDIRYVLLLTIPKKRIWIDVYSEYSENTRNLVYFHSSVILTRIDDDSDRFDLNPTVYLDVYGFKYNNDPCLGNRETIDYKLRVIDWKGNENSEKFEYYRKDEKYDSLVAKLAEGRAFIKRTKEAVLRLEKAILVNQKLRCRSNMLLAITGMFICGLVINGG
jgi:hypothetical protein